MAYAVGRLPVLLQRVHADLSARADVRMEDFGAKPTCGTLLSV